MFLHIGGSQVVAARDVVGIFDIRIKEKQCNREFLQASKKGSAGNSEGKKAFVVTTQEVSFSSIAPGTLRKRFQGKVFDAD